jgi:hypothetical protein
MAPLFLLDLTCTETVFTETNAPIGTNQMLFSQLTTVLFVNSFTLLLQL